jgi:hypothetical protein
MAPLAGNSPSRLILIYCDGGFANRVGSLVSGLALAELFGLGPLVLWPVNNRCGANFEHLFVPSHPALQARLQDLVPYRDTFTAWLHEDDFGFTAPVHRVRDLDHDAVRTLAATDPRPILFAENTFLPWLPADLVDRTLNKLSFRHEITAEAAAVLGGRPVGSFFGIHLRGTDFIPPPPVEQMYDVVVANPQFDFFICSDEPDLEKRFAQNSNVFVHEKNACVEKIDGEGAWRSNVLDSDGLPYTSNIDRTGQSVIQACVDLLLLSAATPIKTSHSSFLALSERMRSSGFTARHLG